MFLIFDDRASDSPMVERIWRCHSERAGTFLSVAASHWVAGETNSRNFPTANAFQPTLSDTGVFRSMNGGGNWSAVNSGLTDSDVRALVVDPVNSTTVYAGTWGGGVLKSTDGGATWSASNAGLTYLNVNALAIDPATPSVLYAATAGALFKSTDAGGTWMNTLGQNAASVAVNPSDPLTVYAGTTNGVFKTTNGGASWSLSNNGFPNFLVWVWSLAIDPITPSTLFASIEYAAIGVNDYQVYKSTDGGSTWSDSSTGLSVLSIIPALAIDPVTPSTLYAGQNPGVFKSTNGGATWGVSRSGLPFGPTPYALAIDPVAPSVVYAGLGADIYGAGRDGGVYRSVDGGGSWGLTLPGPSIVRALAINPSMPSTVYAGAFKDESNAFVTKISP